MIAVFVTATAVSALGMLVVLPLLRRAQVMDVPNARSSHVSPTPRGGGVAVILAILAACLLATLNQEQVDEVALLGVLGYAALGLVDDFRGLDVKVRLVVQLAVAAVVAGSVVSAAETDSLAITAVATVWLVGYTNAFNFMDGVNGISGLNAALAGAWFAYLGITREQDAVAVLAVAITGAALGFLPWNAPRAQVFLGDVGSYGLGFALASLALLTWAGGTNLLPALAPLTVYLADTSWALTKRILGRRPWHQAHREHVYQQLTDRGWPHLASGAWPAAFAASACAVTVAMDAPPALLLLPLLLGAYLATPIIVTRDREKLGAHSE